jgi:hypothetical protein
MFGNMRILVLPIIYCQEHDLFTWGQVISDELNISKVYTQNKHKAL